MRSHVLRDDQWNRIKDFLPGREGHVGGTAADNRLFVDAVIFRYRTGVSWRDLPGRFGNGERVRQRYRRCCKSGVFARLLATRTLDADPEFMSIISTCVRAHQHSALKQYRPIATHYDKLANTVLAGVLLVAVLTRLN